MSLFKLVVYGAVGYLVYQLFFAELPERSNRSGGKRQAAPPEMGGGGAQLTGPGRGKSETVQEPDGSRRTHTVGRGVIS